MTSISSSIGRLNLKPLFVTAASAFAIHSLVSSAFLTERYREPFGLQKEGTGYELTSGHTVRVSDGSGIVHNFNFSTNTVTSGGAEGVRHGGAGYGGMLSFDKVNQEAVKAANVAGCQIAKDVIPNHKPYWVYYTSASYLTGVNLMETNQQRGNIFNMMHCSRG